MRKSIGLQLPERKKPGKDAFDSRPRAVEKWIESLPRASVGHCAQLLYSVLKETNGLEIRHKDRVRMLEALREPVQYVAQAMQKHFVGVAVPLPEKKLKIANAMREIYLLMATGYKIATEDSLSGSMFLDKRNLTTLIHRAISYLSRMLLTTYQVYEPVCENSWLNLHKLYEHAEQLRLHKTAIADNQHQYTSRTTIHGEYTRILMLALSSPYHLRRGEVGNVYVNLERWMNLVSMQGVLGKTLPEGDFIVDLNSDRAPCYLALVDNENLGENVRVLDTHALTETLYNELQKSEQIHSSTLVQMHMEKASLSHDLLQRLSTAWGVIPVRVHKRKQCIADVKLAVGLSATHQAILNYANAHSGFSKAVAAEDSQIMRVIERQSHYQTKAKAHAVDKQPDVWEMVFDNGKLELINAKAVDSALENMPDNVYCTMDGWKLLNQSAAGFCVQCERNCGHSLQVGELVGLSPAGANSPEHWTVGVVRWVRVDRDKRVLVGGQLLGRASIPVGITMAAAVGKGERENVQRALLLPAVKQLMRPSTLLTHHGYYREGAVLRIYLPAGIMEVRLKQKVDSAGVYDEFEYKQTGQLATGDKQEAPLEQRSDSYDDVWSSI